MADQAADVNARSATDADALDVAYARRAGQLWAFARRLGLDSANAEDVMQEAFLRAVRLKPNEVANLDA